MAQRSETGSGKPGYGHVPRARITELDPLRELPYGPAAHNGRIRGRTHVSTRPRSSLIPKTLLASLGGVHTLYVFRGKSGKLIKNCPYGHVWTPPSDAMPIQSIPLQSMKLILGGYADILT